MVIQFLAESGIITFIALIVAIGMAAMVLPFFNELADKAMKIPFSNPIFWLILILCTAVLGLFSGMYPAFFMSKFIPVEVLKGSSNSTTKGGRVRDGVCPRTDFSSTRVGKRECRSTQRSASVRIG